MSTAPTLFQPVLERLGRDVHGYFGDARLRLETVAAQERPFSHLIRVAVVGNDGSAPVSHLFVKVFKRKTIDGRPHEMEDRVARDFESTRRIHRALAPHPHVGAVPPVACYPDLLAIVTEEVPGPTLLDFLQRESAWRPGHDTMQRCVATMENVGRWIKVFQESNPIGPDQAPGNVKEYVDLRLQRIVSASAGEFSEEDRRQVLAHIDRLASQIAPGALRQVLAHSDLSLGNVIVAADGVVVLDFAMAHPDSRLQDVAKVYFQVSLLAMKPRYAAAVLRALQSALLRGFDPSLSADSAAFRLVLLVHRINHLGGLYVNRAPMMEQLYNRAVRWHHRSRLGREMRMPVAQLAER